MKYIRLFFFLAAAAVLAGVASAQTYPGRPIRIVVPYSPGGLPDTIARLVGKYLADSMGQPIVVENRGGAGAIPGTEVVVRAAPDGYTLLMTDAGQVAINPHLYAKLSYDPIRDFAPISLIGTSTLFLTVNASFPASTMQEFVAYVKANPGKVNYGSAGIGSVLHLGLAALSTAYGLEMVHIPYKGTGEAVPALLAGQINVVYSALPAIAQHVKSGRVKMLAASSAQRSPQAPDVPTVAELGIAGYDFGPEMGIVAPAGTPAAIVSKLSGEIARAVKQPEVVQRFSQLGINPVGSSPASYAATIKSSYDRYAIVVKASGARVD